MSTQPPEFPPQPSLHGQPEQAPPEIITPGPDTDVPAPAPNLPPSPSPAPPPATPSA